MDAVRVSGCSILKTVAWLTLARQATTRSLREHESWWAPFTRLGLRLYIAYRQRKRHARSLVKANNSTNYQVIEIAKWQSQRINMTRWIGRDGL